MKITIRVTDNGRTGVVRKSSDKGFTTEQLAAFSKDAAEQAGVTFAKTKKTTTTSN